MILCDTEIRAVLVSRQVIIEPPPLPEHYKTSALDLTLGREFTRWKKGLTSTPGVSVRVDPSAPNFYSQFAAQYQEPAPMDADGAAELARGEFLLALTEQRIELPHESRLAARVEGRSSLARLGLSIHLTAPTIHSGFKGRIALEMTNIGPVPILLRPGLVVCLLIFKMVFGTPSQGMTGMFQDQTSVAGKPSPS